MKDVYFQYYSNSINSSTAIGYVSLKRFIESTKEPKEETKQLFNDIAQATIDCDLKRKAELKSSLYSFTPCVNVTEKRRDNQVIKFTGLLVLDFDKIDNAPEFKEFLFDTYHCIIACYLSPSKKGVKAIVRIPEVQSKEAFKEYYYGIAAEMEAFNGFDSSGQNSVLPLFQSWDSEILYRHDANVWVTKGFKKNAFEQIVLPPTPIEKRPDTTKIILKMIDSGLDKISDNGHPQLRGLCISIGGYIANNYIDYNEALNYICQKIVNHPYLKKGVYGYQNTAKWAINLGYSRPLHLEDKR